MCLINLIKKIQEQPFLTSDQVLEIEKEAKQNKISQKELSLFFGYKSASNYILNKKKGTLPAIFYHALGNNKFLYE